VLLEAAALLQHRIGVAAVRALHEEVTPLLEVDWVTEERHRAGMEAVLAAAREKLSLVTALAFRRCELAECALRFVSTRTSGSKDLRRSRVRELKAAPSSNGLLTPRPLTVGTT
jgi:hypothetical protein